MSYDGMTPSGYLELVMRQNVSFRIPRALNWAT